MFKGMYPDRIASYVIYIVNQEMYFPSVEMAELV